MNIGFLTVFVIIILNTLLAIFMLIWNLMRKRKNLAIAHFAIVLLCPLVGPLFFLGSYILYQITMKDKNLTYGDISFDASRVNKKRKYDFLEEVDILPLQEAFRVSNKKDRRRALLSTIKKENAANIATIFQGLNNEDGETRHYAASVVLNTSTEYLNLISKLKEEYETSDDKVTAAREYLEALKSYMQSDILDPVDKIKYIKIHTDILNWMHKHFRDAVYLEDFIYEINLLVESENYSEATLWSDRAIRSFPEEDLPYYATMKMYYKIGDHKKFKEYLDKIMMSDINISSETLQTIRFFTYKPEPIKL